MRKTGTWSFQVSGKEIWNFLQECSIHYSWHLVGICTQYNLEALTRKYWYTNEPLCHICLLFYLLYQTVLYQPQMSHLTTGNWEQQHWGYIDIFSQVRALVRCVKIESLWNNASLSKPPLNLVLKTRIALSPIWRYREYLIHCHIIWLIWVVRYLKSKCPLCLSGFKR